MGIREVREIDETVNRLRGKDTEGVSVFHGRDLFGYCAARLASGIITYEQVGPAYPVEEIKAFPILEPVLEDGKVRGIFEIGDPNFGNLWTNIPRALFAEAGFEYGDQLKLTVRHEGREVFAQRVPFHESFGYVQKGEVIIYNNELMRISVAVNQGSFAERFELGFGSDWEVEFEK